MRLCTCIYLTCMICTAELLLTELLLVELCLVDLYGFSVMNVFLYGNRLLRTWLSIFLLRPLQLLLTDIRLSYLLRILQFVCIGAGFEHSI
jgi:hypothetical protein